MFFRGMESSTRVDLVGFSDLLCFFALKLCSVVFSTHCARRDCVSANKFNGKWRQFSTSPKGVEVVPLIKTNLRLSLHYKTRLIFAWFHKHAVAAREILFPDFSLWSLRGHAIRICCAPLFRYRVLPIYALVGGTWKADKRPSIRKEQLMTWIFYRPKARGGDLQSNIHFLYVPVAIETSTKANFRFGRLSIFVPL